MSRIALVVARADNGVIGRRGELPWRIAEDMRRFKTLTMGKPCIMGRRTWDSLIRKPLPGRTNIVVTRNREFSADGAHAVGNLRDALTLANGFGSDEIAVIGGAGIYRDAIPLADRIYLTEIHADFEGDTMFPTLRRDEWKEAAREPHVGADGLSYDFVTLERTSSPG
ncbi:MAG TPA: dihydrofolate reductase [Rhizomicrobium sp.]